ncbi:MAG: alpha/beta hydrolase [Bacteroidota bacterium]|nr:alpha/beta hydrolase [Bacteroidota bacterium]
MKESFLSFDYKARYFQLGELNPETEDIWIIFHGYGQLASYFIKKFKDLEKEGICLIVPEGLNRFYLQGFAGRVGATWMTKEDRLTDIENYISYLNRLYDDVIAPAMSSRTKLTLFGFSQGCATMARWALQAKFDFHRIIIWAGVIPPDLDFEQGKEVLKNKISYFVYGTEDPFLEGTSVENIFKLVEKLEIKPTVFTFKGGHEIDADTLKKFI